MTRSLPKWAFAALAVPVLILGIACGSDNKEKTDITSDTQSSQAAMQVEDAVRNAVDAYGRQDLNGFLASWTDDGLKAEFEATRQEMQDAGDDFFNGPPRRLRSLGDTNVDGSKATTDADFVVGRAYESERLTLVRQQGSWKIDGTERLTVSIPKDVSAVEVNLDEFAFEMKDRINSGNIAFKVKNIGRQDHELVLAQVPSGFTLNSAAINDIMENGPPPGLDLVAALAPVRPGESTNLVLTEPLASGKYIMICFFPDSSDPDGTPHIAKGMASEFNITSQARAK